MSSSIVKLPSQCSGTNGEKRGVLIKLLVLHTYSSEKLHQSTTVLVGGIWCKDKWGISWQITPRALTEAMIAGGDEAKRAFDAMMTMKKIDVAKIEEARRG